MPQSNAFKFANNILTNGGYDAADLVGAAGGGNAPYFRATATSATGLTDGAYTLINFDQETFDSDNCYNTSTKKFLPTTAGYYFIDLSILFYGTPGGNPMSNAIAVIYKNGANTISNNNGMNVNGNNVFYFYLCRSQHIIYFNGTTDYVEPYGVINSSGQRNYDGGNCTFQGFKIG